MRRASSVVVAIALLFGAVAATSGAAAAQTPTWTIRPSVSPPGPKGAEFDDVACATPTRCFAVGVDWTFPNVNEALIEEWDGTQWSLIPTPAGGVALYDIACPTATSCLAVGAKSGKSALVERWDGTAWSIDTTAIPSEFDNFTFNILACASATLCFATAQGSGAVAEWNGATWSAATMPSISPSTGLNDLTCAGPTRCVAVGETSLDGTTWSIVASAVPPVKGVTYVSTRGLACASATSCVGVGYTGAAAAARWDGTTWSVVAVPQPKPSQSTLAAVSCTNVSCFAVGSYQSPVRTSPLIEEPTAAGWVVVPSPNPSKYSSTVSTLSGVWCVTATFCFAVGHATGTTAISVVPLIERWNGQTWSIVRSPAKLHASNYLDAVTCTSTKNCFAVGRYTGAGDNTLIEHWNGSTWSLVPSPNPHGITTINELHGVACTSATSCFAVGSDRGYYGNYSETMIEHWNGSKWSIGPSPNGPGTKFSNLSSVSCPSANGCFAVGQWFTGFSTGARVRTLIVHWDGTKWTRIASSDPAGSLKTTLLGVSCPTSTSCVAVGSKSGSSGRNSSTLVETFSGSSWSIGPSPSPAGGTDAALNGVACVSPAVCSAVGNFTDTLAHNTLVEHSS